MEAPCPVKKLELTISLNVRRMVEKRGRSGGNRIKAIHRRRLLPLIQPPTALKLFV
jgi:hypothetical protein